MRITRDHIVRYLDGTLPHDEAHVLEMMMLEDPFLADAIEGLELDDPSRIEETLKDLETIIEANYGKVRKVVPLYRNPIAIAAAVSLIVLSVAVVFLVPDYREKFQSLWIPSEDKEVAETLDTELMKESSVPVETEKDESPVVDTTNYQAEPEPELLITQDTEIHESIVSDTSVLEEETFLATDEETVAEDVLAQAEPLTIVDSSGFGETGAEFAVAEEEPLEFTTEETLAEISADQAQPSAKRVMGAETRGASSNTVIGTVVSANDNQPIAGVNILISGTTRGIITDDSGAYILQLADSENQLEFASIGYQSQSIDVSDRGTFNVSMQPDVSQISEVVAIGYGGTDNRTGQSDRFASPANGRVAFNSYLRNNLSYPDSAASNGITGRVIIEFLVSPNGSIQNLQVVNSLGYGCDEEAIRLINEGPSWTPAIRNGSPIEERIRVAIRFRPQN